MKPSLLRRALMLLPGVGLALMGQIANVQGQDLSSACTESYIPSTTGGNDGTCTCASRLDQVVCDQSDDTCKAKTFVNCTVECTNDQSCEDATFQDATTATCSGWYSCLSANFHDVSTVTCSGQYSCWGARMFDDSRSYCTVNEACPFVQIDKDADSACCKSGQEGDVVPTVCPLGTQCEGEPAQCAGVNTYDPVTTTCDCQSKDVIRCGTGLCESKTFMNCNVECGGLQSCQDSVFQGDSTAACDGLRSCRWSEFEDATTAVCAGQYSCRYAGFLSTSSASCAGDQSCDSARTCFSSSNTEEVGCTAELTCLNPFVCQYVDMYGDSTAQCETLDACTGFRDLEVATLTGSACGSGIGRPADVPQCGEDIPFVDACTTYCSTNYPSDISCYTDIICRVGAIGCHAHGAVRTRTGVLPDAFCRFCGTAPYVDCPARDDPVGDDPAPGPAPSPSPSVPSAPTTQPVDSSDACSVMCAELHPTAPPCVTDSACAQGGLGCNAHGERLCRFLYNSNNN